MCIIVNEMKQNKTIRNNFRGNIIRFINEMCIDKQHDKKYRKFQTKIAMWKMIKPRTQDRVVYVIK